MGKQLYQNLGTSPDNNLVADAEGLVRIGAIIHPGEGELDRGTILAKDASGMYKPAVSGAMTGKMLCILDEAVDSGSDTTGDGVSARVYERGTFIYEKVALVSGTLSADDQVAMRTQGLFLRVLDGTIDNEV